MARLHDPTKARRHWVYTRQQLGEKFDVCDSTIANWIGRGLEPVDDKRPQLFSGYKVRQFLTNMCWPNGRSPENGRLFCPICLGFKALVDGSIQTLPRDSRCINVIGKCSECHNMLQSGVRPYELGPIYKASANTAGHSSDVIDGGVSGDIGRKGASIPPETTSSNLRWLYRYRVYLENHQNWDPRTVDEHLRSVSRMSALFNHKAFEKVTIADACRFKDELRYRRDLEGKGELSRSTVLHTLDRCRAFFKWLQHQSGVDIVTDLPGYFSLSRKERAAESSMVKGTSLTFDQALRIFVAMPRSKPVELRNRAAVAKLITTGIRIGALITLCGKHVNVHTRWINQDPREVDTKLGKHIRTYILDLGFGLIAAIEEWARWRSLNGFGDDAPFFLPDRYIVSVR